MAAEKSLKSIFFFILKLGIAGAVIYFLLLRNPDEILRSLRHCEFKYVLAAAVVYSLHMLVAAWRWGCLARIPGIRLSHFEAVSLSMQGYFFSLVIPGGAIGGDVVKMGVLAGRTPKGEKFEGVFSILMDRIIGMIALFSMALVLIPLNYNTRINIDIPGIKCERIFPQLIVSGLALLCLAGLAASSVIFFHRLLRKIPLMDKLMLVGDKFTRGMVSRMTAATDTYSKNKKELTILTIVSIFGIHLLTALPVCLLLTGLGAQYSILTVVTALTIGNIIGLIPLFPAGLGGRDVTAIAIMTAGGIASNDAKTAQLVYTAILLIVSLADGLFFVFDRGRKHTKDEPEDKI